MISKGFLKSSIVYTLGGAMPMVGSIILLPFYANRLNDLHFLQVAFYISITILFQIIFTFSLDTFFGVKYTQLSAQPEKQRKFIGTTAILLLAIGAFWLAITALSGPFLIHQVFKEEYEMNFWPYGFYSVLTAFFNSYFKTSTNALIYIRKPVLFLVVNFINFIFTLLISIGGLHLFPDSIIGPMYGRLLSGVIIFFLGHFIFMTYGTFKFEKEFLPDIKKFCVPFLFYGLSFWALSQIDRFMLQYYIDKVDLNTYDLVLKCFFGIEFLQNSLSAVIFPKLYEIWSKQERLTTTKESNRYFNVFTAVNIIQLIAFCIVIPLLYDLLIKKQSFHEASSYIGILAAGYSVRSILNFYLSTILFSKSTTTLLKIYGFSALFQIGITWLASMYMGLMGVIYAGIITKILQVVLSAGMTKGIFVYEFNYFKIYLIPALYIVLNVAQFYFFPDYDIRLYLAQLALFTIVFYFVFRNEIRQVLIQFKILNV
jgi:O-antigen/teichoic acid export membrane protein